MNLNSVFLYAVLISCVLTGTPCHLDVSLCQDGVQRSTTIRWDGEKSPIHQDQEDRQLECGDGAVVKTQFKDCPGTQVSQYTANSVNYKSSQFYTDMKPHLDILFKEQQRTMANQAICGAPNLALNALLAIQLVCVVYWCISLTVQPDGQYRKVPLVLAVIFLAVICMAVKWSQYLAACPIATYFNSIFKAFD